MDGRFISKDVYEGQIHNPLSLNLYTYVQNNPLTFVDPTGNAPFMFDFKGGSGPRGFSGYERGGGSAGGRGSSTRVIARTNSLKTGPYKVSSGSNMINEKLYNLYTGRVSNTRDPFKKASVSSLYKGTPKAGAGNLIKDSSSYKKLAKNHSAEDLIKNLERNGWTKVVDPPRSARSGEAIKFTNPESGDVIRIMPNPADGKPYFKVQNKGGGWLDEFGNFPSNATKQELRDLTHFYFEK